MIIVEEYRRLDETNRRVAVLLAFWGEPLDPRDIVRMTRTLPKPITLTAAATAFKHLTRRGWIGHPGDDPRSSRFVFAAKLSRAAFEAMAREGTESSWWPAASAFAKPTRDLFPELHRSSSFVARAEPTHDMLVSEGIRLFASGTGAAASTFFRTALDGNRGRELARSVAFCVSTRFEESPNFRLVANDPLLRLMRYWLNLAFACGHEVTGALKSLHDLFVGRQRLTVELARAYWACCAWAGRADLFDTPWNQPDAAFFAGCRAVLDGDVVRADTCFRQDDLSDSPQYQKGERDYDNLVERALLAHVAAAVKPEKPAKMRPKALLEGSAVLRYVSSASWGERGYMRLSTDLAKWAGAAWHQTADVGGSVIVTFAKRPAGRLFEALSFAWDYYRMPTGRSVRKDAAEKLWAQTKRFDAAGWSNAARLLAALLAGGYDRTAEADYLKDLDSRTAELLPRREPEPEWKNLLTALEKALPKVPRKKKDGTEIQGPKARLVWRMDMTEGDDGVMDIEMIFPSLRKAGAKEDGSEDERLESYDLQRKRVRDLMSPQDLLIAAARYPAGYGECGVSELMDALGGAPNVERVKRKYTDWDSYYAKVEDVAIERRPCEMTSSVSEDGGLVLAAPKWALEGDVHWRLRRLGEGRYVFTELTKEVRKLLDVFRTLGSGGRFVIPREGMKRAEPLVAGMTALMPLAEPSADQADQLRRVPAESVLRVRLDFSDGVLVVRAVILPLADNPNLSLEPGFGPVEKVVVGAVASFVLVRDLAAEKAAFEPVRAALAEMESSFDGKATWRFEEIAEALAALTRLKALGEAAPLEWVNDRRLSVATAPKSGVRLASQRTADDWFRVDGSFTLDDGRILSVVAMLEAARNRVGNYVKLSDSSFVAITKAMAKELDALNAAGRRKGDGVEIVKAAVPMLDGAFGGDDPEALELPDAMAVTAAEIRAAFAKRPQTPKTLNAELRPYQEDGYRWLSRLAACGFGACLADDMGLGKTVQVIALLLERAAHGASLVIAPSSVCGNWRRELERFAPSLRPVMALEEEIPLAAAKARDVVIASYGYLLFHGDDFAGVTWNGLVLDEAQAIKNDASKRAKTVKRLHAKFRVAATGTPVENRLGELWSLFDFLNPGLLGPAASFAQRFTVEGKAVPELKRLVKPLILRRLKGDVLDDLPDKTEVTIPVVLGTAERTAYEGCRQHALATLAEKSEGDSGANRMSILAELTRLRRFCCHPSLVLPGAGVPSAKMEALIELLDGLREGHHRALVFSQFTDYLALVRKVLEARGWSYLYLDGSTPTLERERLVNAFQGGEGDFFLISLKAGGTGLNLTAANYVILLDPWWNPAVENQAADRAHRIGQKNPVTVYRLIAQDTVEARVIELHREKKEIAEDVLDGTSSSALSPAQLMKLFG